MVKFFDIYEQDKLKFRKNIEDIKNIIKNTNFINGKHVFNFERNFAKFCNTKYAVGCNSGSDALFLSLKALNLKKNSDNKSHIIGDQNESIFSLTTSL